ncbi:MAG TPA: biotin/lipoyl-containing protein [Thermoanaerobaculia bacterium]
MIEIELDGERRQVALRREDDRWIAEIDGRTVEVSVVEAGGRWSMLVESGFSRIGSVESGFSRIGYEPGSSRISYEIAFEPGAAGELIIHVNGVAIPLTINESRRRHSAGDPRADSGSRMIVAPMPGRIVKVLVKPQEQVSARQPLVVVEAMKMENELRAPRGGTVAEVRVAEGSSVEANTVLVVLE